MFDDEDDNAEWSVQAVRLFSVSKLQSDKSRFCSIFFKKVYHDHQTTVPASNTVTHGAVISLVVVGLWQCGTGESETASIVS